MKFKLRNTTFEISFLLLLLVCFCLLANSYDILSVLLFCSLHELGHLLFLAIFKQKILNINLSYYGIGIKFDSTLSEIQEIIYLLAGPIVNLILSLLNISKDINNYLFLINVIPIYPFDGGRILLIIFDRILGIDVSYRFFGAISNILIALLLLIGLFKCNLSLALIGLYALNYSVNNSYD